MKRYTRSNEQKLINIMFQIGLTIHNSEWFQGKTNEEVAEWIASQLRECGFDTQPMGCSWGVLK